MNKQIRQFLDELYEIDPTLRSHEAELTNVIETLLKNNPGIDPDERFVQMLRVKLNERAAQLSASKPSFFSSFFMPKYSYGVIGAILGVLITGPVVYQMTKPVDTAIPNQVQQNDFFAYQVSPVSKRAFGDISALQAGGRGQGGGGGPAMGMGGDAAIAPAPATDGATAPQAENSAKMIAPPGDYVYTDFNYVYKGEDFTVPSGDVSVFKRIKQGLTLPGFNLGSADLGIFNLSAFPGLKLESVGGYQDTKDGYTIYLSARDGSMNIGQNWEKWDHPESSCRDEACFQRLRLKIGDVPSDEQLIAIADKFLQDRGFKLGNVGTPIVDGGWKLGYEQSADKAQYYIPDQISVIYPMLVEGKEVYEEYGNKTGVSVGIDIRNKKVAGVWNLYNQNYQSSAYPAVTDKQVILDHLASFEKQATEWLPKDAKRQTLDVELGTPTEGFVHMYQYKDNSNDDLYVPALIFPVTKMPAGKDVYYSRQYIAVPLAADLLKQQNGMGRPMPVDGPVRIMEPLADGVEE